MAMLDGKLLKNHQRDNQSGFSILFLKSKSSCGVLKLFRLRSKWLTGDNLRISKSVSEIAQSVDIDFLDTLAKI
jgi:hypothetical protein